MKKRFYLENYTLIDGGHMIIIRENHSNGFVNHRWVFGPENVDYFKN